MINLFVMIYGKVKTMKNIFFLFIIFSLILFQSTSSISQYILKRGNGTEPDSLDPHKATGTWENNIIGDIFIGLVTESPSGNIIPGMAKDWDINNNGKDYIFHLRDNILWSDGVPLTAEDFVFSLKRILNPSTASQYASLLFNIKHAKEIYNGNFSDDRLGVHAIDSRTLKITLENPVPFFIQLLSHYTTYPLPSHVVRAYGEEWIKPSNIVSNGAYILSEWSSNNHILLSKNLKFYDSENTFFDKVYFYPIEDNRLALRMFQAGDIDMNITTSAFPVSELERLIKDFPEQARVYPYLGNSYLPFNMSKPPFNDIRVRKAVSMIINREIINDKVVKAGNDSAYSFIPPQTQNFLPGAVLDFTGMTIEQRKGVARRLLLDAGYDKNNPLKFEIVFRNSFDNARRISAIAAMLKREGVYLKMLPFEARIAYNKMSQKDFELGDAGWVADYNDPYNFLFLFKCDAGPMNYSQFCDDEFENLLIKASKAKDLIKRSEIMKQAEQIMLDNHPIIPISFATHRVLISEKIAGYVDNISNIHRSRFFYLK